MVRNIGAGEAGAMTPRQKEIMDHAEVLFKPEWSVLREKHNEELREAQFKATKSGNGAAMAPAEAECFISHTKALVAAKAESIAAAHNAFHEPAGPEAERALASFASTVTAARKSAFIHQVTSRATRTGKPQPHLTGVVMDFDRTCYDAVQEGKRTLAMQRVAKQNQVSHVVPVPAFMVDTCVFNWLLDGKIQRAALPSGGRFAITHIQMDELNKIQDEERRVRLSLLVHATMKCEVIPTQTFVFDVSRWDHACWGDGELFNKIRDELDAANKRRKSNTQDALIAETAIQNGYTLITADGGLKWAAEKHGGVVIFFSPPSVTK
jgi:rRNA-processing protein FCF1